MKRLQRTRAFIALALALSLASEAGAYCYYNQLTWKRGGGVLEAIPIYLDFGPAGDLRRTGLSDVTLISYMLTIIEEVNRASVTAPRLYFGGIRRPQSLMRLDDLPDGSGIHVRAALCSSDDTDVNDNGKLDDDPGATAVANRGAAGTNKALIRTRTLLDRSGELCPVFEPWNTLGALQVAAGEPQCMEPFPGVFSPVKGYCIPYKDFKGVIMHELVHVLGLAHHQLDGCQCADLNGTHSDDFVPTWGTVRSETPSLDGSGRRLWRDDIEGLEALYSANGLGPGSWRVVEYRSPDGSSWEPVDRVPLAQRTTTPVSVTSATDPERPVLYLAYADEGRFVRVARRDGDGGAESWTDLGRVAPDLTATRTDDRVVPAGVTYHPPAVAYAPPNDEHGGQLGIAWVFEDETDERAYIRWGVRPEAGGDWTIWTGRIPVNARLVKLGYDPVHDWFLLAHLDGIQATDDPRHYGYLRTFDPENAQLNGGALLLKPISVGLQGDDVFQNPGGGGEGFVEALHDLGKPVCRQVGGDGPFDVKDSRCVVPVATTGQNGPCLGWYYGTRTNDGLAFETLEREIFCLRDFGLNDLALDPDLPRAHVGSLVHFFLGPDPVAVPPPQGFDCAAFGICPDTAITEARVRYRMETTGTGGGLGQVTTQNQAQTFGLGTPFDVGFIPGTNFLQPGPDDPGPWWPAAVGSLGDTDDPFRIFVTEVDQRCGNGIVEDGEQCEPGNLDGATCNDAGFGDGDLSCNAQCRFDTSECGPPGCEGGPGEPNCDCVPVQNSIFCDLDEDGCFPDGPGSFTDSGANGDGLYCPDNFVGPSVCAFKKLGGQLRSVCQACPDSPGTGEAGYGCPCSTDSQCAAQGRSGPTSLDFSGPLVPLSCFGSENPQGWQSGPGLCLPSISPSGSNITSQQLFGQNAVEEFERTRWLCKANCNSITDATNVPHICVSKQLEPSLDFFNAACVDAGSCAGLAVGACEEGGQRCDPNSDACINECDSALNSPNGNPGCGIWGYPPGYQCTEGWQTPPRCVPSACAQSPFATGLDFSFCEQFVNGGG